MKKIIIFLLLCGKILFAHRGNFIEVNSLEEFNNIINHVLPQGPNLALVFFFKYSERNQDKFKFEKFFNAILRVNNKIPYINLVVVDLEKNDLSNLEDIYKIKRTPLLMLFKDGDVFVDEKNQLASIYGFIDKNKIESFVLQNFAQDIEDIQEKNNMGSNFAIVPNRKPLYYEYFDKNYYNQQVNKEPVYREPEKVIYYI